MCEPLSSRQSMRTAFAAESYPADAWSSFEPWLRCLSQGEEEGVSHVGGLGMLLTGPVRSRKTVVWAMHTSGDRVYRIRPAAIQVPAA